jgi:hypothetical protein
MLGWLPSNGRGETTLLFGGLRVSFLSIDGLKHLADAGDEPRAVQSGAAHSPHARRARTSALQDYVKFARAKGLTNQRVIGVHVLRNILIPIVTGDRACQFGALIGFAIVTESVFAWPAWASSLSTRSACSTGPVIVAYLLVIVTFFILINLLGRRSVFGARSAHPADGSQGMSGLRPPRSARSRREARTPFRRIVADFVANPVAIFGLALLGSFCSSRSSRL